MSRPKFQLRIKDFTFNLRELAGSIGDFGTLFPLAIGYFAVCGLNPAGLLVMMGLANIVTGIDGDYRQHFFRCAGSNDRISSSQGYLGAKFQEV